MRDVRVRPHRRTKRPQAITTEQAIAHQRARHIIAHKTMQRIYPTAEARQWALVYRATESEAQFGVILTWLKLIALNEADAQPWDDIYEAAMDDSRLDDRDREVLAELVLAMQQRSTLGPSARTAAETEREYAQLMDQFQVQP